MFILYASSNCGISYYKDKETQTLKELDSRMKEHDENMTRWYVEENGKIVPEARCHIHKHIVKTLTFLNK